MHLRDLLEEFEFEEKLFDEGWGWMLLDDFFEDGVKVTEDSLFEANLNQGKMMFE